MWMPFASSALRRSSPLMLCLALARLITRPAPWQEEPKERSMLPCVPTSTHEAVPMLPGTSTGCPMLRYSSGKPS